MSANEMTVETLLRAHAPLAPERLRTRVLALEPRRMPSRRLVLVLAAALALAVAAAVVHGLVSPGATPHERSALLPATHPAATFSGSGGTLAKVPAVSGSGTRLQRTEATLALRVGDASAAATEATRIATSLGGYAQSVTYSSASRSASVVLRIPVANVRPALARLESLGTVVSQRLSVTDLEHLLQLESSQIAQLRSTVAALEAALAGPSLPEAQRVLLQIRLANAKRALSQRLHARDGTIAAGTTARVALDLETRSAVVPAPHRHGRLGRMVHSAVGFLGLEGTAALYLLIVLAPFVLAAGLGWSLLRARRRLRRRLVME